MTQPIEQEKSLIERLRERVENYALDGDVEIALFQIESLVRSWDVSEQGTVDDIKAAERFYEVHKLPKKDVPYGAKLIAMVRSAVLRECQRQLIGEST